MRVVDIAIADDQRRRSDDLLSELIVFHTGASTLVYSNYTVESHVKKVISEPIVVITSAPDRVLRFENNNTSKETIAVFWHPSAEWREPWCRAFIIELVLSIGGVLVPHAIFEIIEWLNCLRTWGRIKLVTIIEDVYRSLRQIVAKRTEVPVTRLRLKMKNKRL